jgi:phospholipid/cholesterol/gamma-HCH transport system substrate-binding protein
MDIEEIERREIRKKQMVVAALFVSAMLVAMIFAYWMGAFGVGPSKTLHIKYNFAGGIDKGSPVRLAGIKVGRVTDISFSAEDTKLDVQIEVNNEAFREVTVDSQFYINLAGLIGERYIEVVPGEGEKVAPKASLRGVDPPRVDQLLSQGYGIAGDLRKFWNENKGDMKEIFTTLNDLTRNLNRLLASATPAQRKQISAILENLAGVTGKANAALDYMEANGGKATWDSMNNLFSKADKIKLNDIRRLMLEDGVKVNLGGQKIPREEEIEDAK